VSAELAAWQAAREILELIRRESKHRADVALSRQQALAQALRHPQPRAGAENQE